MAIPNCGPIPCPVILDATCVFYEGPNLPFTGIHTNDNFQHVLEDLETMFESGGLSGTSGTSGTSATSGSSG